MTENYDATLEPREKTTEQADCADNLRNRDGFDPGDRAIEGSIE